MSRSRGNQWQSSREGEQSSAVMIGTALPSSPIPEPDETLSSWFARLCDSLESDVRPLQRRLGLLPQSGRWEAPISGLRLSTEQITAISSATDLTEHQIEGMLLSSIPALPMPGSGTRRLGGWTKANLIRPDQTARCPDCVRESGVWKRSWRLGWVFGCLVHERLLAAACAKCGLPFGLNSKLRAEGRQCRCSSLPSALRRGRPLTPLEVRLASNVEGLSRLRWSSDGGPFDAAAAVAGIHLRAGSEGWEGPWDAAVVRQLTTGRLEGRGRLYALSRDPEAVASFWRTFPQLAGPSRLASIEGYLDGVPLLADREKLGCLIRSLGAEVRSEVWRQRAIAVNEVG